MNTISIMLMSAALVASTVSAASPIFGIDTVSNGHYWWGGSWVHAPASGGTSDCVCVFGTMNNGQEEAACRGEGIPAGYWIPFPLHDWDTSKPVEIATFGSDALWIDRFQWGSKWFGSDNTAGWCLSEDRDDTSFDEYSTVPAGRCYRSLLLTPSNGLVVAHPHDAIYHSSKVRGAVEMCRAGVAGRRRVEGEIGEESVVELQQLGDAEPILSTAGDKFAEVKGLASNGDKVEIDEFQLALGDELVNAEASRYPEDRAPESRATKALRERLVQLIGERKSIEPEELDEILNGVMLEAEHEEERKTRDGETVDIGAEA